jgi:hypothetical protein
MDDAGYLASGMLLHTPRERSFTKADVMLLISVLDSNFGIKATLRAAGEKWIIYVPAAYMSTVRSTVLPDLPPVPHTERGGPAEPEGGDPAPPGPDLHSSMLYKIHA